MRPLLAGAAFALSLGLLAGCGRGFSRDLQMMCKTPETFPVAENPDPAERATKIAQYWQKNLRSREGGKFLSGMAFVDPDRKAEIFALTLEENGIDPKSCAFLTEMLEERAFVRPTETPSPDPAPAETASSPSPR